MKQTSNIIIGLTIFMVLFAGSCTRAEKLRSANSSNIQSLKIRCMTYNILEGGNSRDPVDWKNSYFTSTEDRIPLLIKLIEEVNPDIVFLQECNGWANNNNEKLNRVANAVGMHGVIAPNNGSYLVAMLSRFPIASYSWQPDDSIFRWNILCADIELPNGKILKVASTHYGWWGNSKWQEKGTTKKEKLQVYIRQTDVLIAELEKYKDMPFIIGGDLNHPDLYHASRFPDDGEHADIPIELIRRFYPRISAMGYVDVYQALNKTYENKRTAAWLRLGVLDHILTTRVLADKFTKCEIIESELAYHTSDHLPIYADIELP